MRQRPKRDIRLKSADIVAAYCRWAGYPFASAGALTALAAAGIYGEGERGFAMVVVGVVVCMVGVAMVVVGHGLRGGQDRWLPRQVRFPDEPWLWRKCWAQGYMHDEVWLRLGLLWVGVLALNGIVWTVAWTFLQRDIPLVGTAGIALIILIAVAQTANAVSRTRIAVRFGASALRLETVPARRGGTLRASLDTGLAAGRGGAIEVTLRCLRFRIRHQKERPEDLMETLHEATFTCPAAAIPGRRGLVFPLEIPVPENGEDTGPRRAPYHRVEWRLGATGPPGYACEFQVPVYGAAPVPATASSGSASNANHSSR
jgi:hypothetical protein